MPARVPLIGTQPAWAGPRVLHRCAVTCSHLWGTEDGVGSST